MNDPSLRGTLWLVPNALDLGVEPPPPLEYSLPRGAIERAASLSHWVVEDAKSARAFLKRVHVLRPLVKPLQELDIRELPRAPKDGSSLAADWTGLLQPALAAGDDLGLLSEAGLPAVADPGSGLVAAAHAAGVEVHVLPGPSSITLALAASGLNGQSFSFVGYLPTDPAERDARVRELEQRSQREHQTQLAIETPYRNATLASALIQALRPGTRLSIASGLTLAGGWCKTQTVSQWRASLPRFDHKHHPAVFAWLAA